MTISRPARFLRGIVSLISVIGLTVGVPLMLVAWVGWPLPTKMPTLDSFELAARSGISDQVIVNTLAVVAWIVWVQLILSLVVEVVAVGRGRQTRPLPVLPGFQVAAAQLVAGVLMIASILQPARVSATPLAIPIVAEAPMGDGISLAEPFQAMPERRDPRLVAYVNELTSLSAAADHPTMTVQRHDSYWAIAERTLGDGLRWREILDLNVGRRLADGTIITADNEILHTGWVLILPIDAMVDSEPNTVPLEPVGDIDDLTTVVVERGDNLWSISQDRLEVDLKRGAVDSEIAPYWREVIDANGDRFVQPGNPNLIYPGQSLVLPPTGIEDPAAVAAAPSAQPAPSIAEELTPPASPEASPSLGDWMGPSPTTTPPPSGPGVPTEHLDETTHTEASNGDVAKGDTAQSDESSNRALPIGLAASGLSSVALAVGLKRLLGRRRQRFANRHPGHLPGRVPAEHREFHQGVIAQADEELIVDLQCALSRLAVVLAEAGSERRPRIVRHSPDCLEVLLDQPDTSAPPGWISTDDGTVWTLISPPEEDYLAEAELTPSPLMVTVGQPDEDAQLYLDLEAEGLLSLTGDRDVATSLARSIVTELTLSPLAESLRVIVVGDIISSEAKVLDHLRIVDNWDSLVEDLTSWATESHETLVEHNWVSTFVGRAHEPDHDALIPLAVVAAEPPPSELMKALQAAWPSAVAIVAVGEFDGALASIRCEEHALNFDPIGLACSPQKLEADGLEAISSILAAADSPTEPKLAEQLRVEFEELASSNGNGRDDHQAPIAAVEEEFSAALDGPPEFDVLVRLLGDITVEGGEALKPKATAVVAYLALHRSVTTERLEEACWFGSDGTSHTKRLHDTMTESRAALGSQHFPANRGGSYVAGPRVLTDLDLFDWHVTEATDLPSDEAVGRYVAALDLVTGRPFSYPNAARASYGWVDFEHHATTWELRVAGVAQACAAMYLDMGEPGAAIAMLRRIVRAVPLNSAVVEALMRAHIANGDRSGMESVYKEHVAALDQAKLGDPADSIEQLRLDLHLT